MFVEIRRDLSPEDGMSLIEMMVALFIVTVALLALLGVLVGSARAVAEQDRRSRATRVGTTHIERIRELLVADFTRDPSTLPGVTPLPVIDGATTYTVTTTVQAANALDASLGPDGQALVVGVDVAWNGLGGLRSSRFDTLVAPPEAPPARIEVTVAPDTATVGSDGHPGHDLTLVIRTVGFEYLSAMTVEVGGGGSGAAVSVPPVTGSTERQVTIPKGEVTVTDLATTGSVTFSVGAGGVEGVGAVRLVPESAAGGPILTNAAVVSPAASSTIDVRTREQNCNGQNKCTNHDPVTFQLDVEPNGWIVDVVQVDYSVRGGQGSLALTRPASGTTWTTTVAANSSDYGKFQPGPQTPFTFKVYYSRSDLDGSTTTAAVPQIVTVPRHVQEVLS